MNKLLLLIPFLSLAICNIKLGGFEKESFASNDMRVDKSWKTTEKEYFRLTGHNEKDVYLYPIAIYKQLVNGINYKISFAAHDRKQNTVKVYEYMVLCGLVAKNDDPFPFEVVSIKELPKNDNIPINNSKYGKINNMVNSFSIQNNDKISYVNTIQSSESMFNTGVYIVLGQTKKSRKNNSYIVFEDEDGHYDVIAQLR